MHYERLQQKNSNPLQQQVVYCEAEGEQYWNLPLVAGKSTGPDIKPPRNLTVPTHHHG